MKTKEAPKEPTVEKRRILLLCVAMMAMTATAQVTAVRCTEDDYNTEIRNIILCQCLPLSRVELSPADSIKIDSLLRHNYLAAEGYGGSEYDLWWRKEVRQRTDNKVYIVEYGPELKSSGEPVGTDHTAFIDTLFHPLGSVVGYQPEFSCCAYEVATIEEQRGDVPPVLHLYRWGIGKALPKEVGRYAPKDFVSEEYYWDFGGTLFVKGYELVDEVYEGNTVYMRISIE